MLIKLDNVPVPLPIPVPDITPLSPPLGLKSPMPLKIEPLTGLAGFTPIEAAAVALAKASDAANVISGSGSLDVLRYGSILDARTIVRVHGAGITYDGDYFVDTVTHTIKPGSYKQSFTLVRNALIAGTGSLFDALSFALSVPQQLAGFATSAVESAADTAADVAASFPSPTDLGLPAPVPSPHAPAPSAAATRLASSMPASPTP